MLAEQGKRVLACEVDAKGDLAAAYEVAEVGFSPVETTNGVSVMTMDTEASLREYLKLNLRIPIVGRIGPLAKAFDFVATASFVTRCASSTTTQSWLMPQQPATSSDSWPHPKPSRAWSKSD